MLAKFPQPKFYKLSFLTTFCWLTYSKFPSPLRVAIDTPTSIPSSAVLGPRMEISRKAAVQALPISNVSYLGALHAPVGQSKHGRCPLEFPLPRAAAMVGWGPDVPSLHSAIGAWPVLIGIQNSTHVWVSPSYITIRCPKIKMKVSERQMEKYLRHEIK